MHFIAIVVTEIRPSENVLAAALAPLPAMARVRQGTISATSAAVDRWSARFLVQDPVARAAPDRCPH
jgi:hypothetical protein